MTTAAVAENSGSAAVPLRWLEMHGDSLYAYAIRRVRRPETAEDLVQETLLAALQSWNEFGRRSEVKTWLIRILRNKIADHYRTQYRHLTVEPVDDDHEFNSRGVWRVALQRWHANPAELVEQREFRKVIDGCLSKLPTRMAHLFLTRSTTDATTADLCTELGITNENAWMLLHRARSRLRQCLNVNWFDGSSRRDSQGTE